MKQVSTMLAVLFLLSAMAPNPATATEVVSEAARWQQQAVRSLTYKGEPLTLSEQGGFKETEQRPLCVRLNNYGCVKQGSEPWNGTNGRQDGKGHAVFEDPAFSIRAVVRDYCSKYKRGLRTTVALADAYSPWCDTLGSHAVYNGWARSCGDSPQAPAGFTGPICKKPEGEPTAAQCASCNCPSMLAELWLDGLSRDGSGPGPYDDLALFDSTGKPNEAVFSVLLKNKIRIELGGFEPTAALIQRGIALAGVCR